MPRFSVIIPVHNRAGLVRATIDSALAQTWPDREVVVADDASTDATPEVLRSYGDRIRVVSRTVNGGCEMAYVSGAEAARGDYFVFLDSDDLLYPWALETYDYVLGATADPALLVSRLAAFTAEPPALAAPQAGDVFEYVRFADYLARDRRIASSLSMVVVRREVYAAAGGFRRSTATTHNGSDHDFLLRVGCHGPAVLLERPQTVAYRVHDGNATRNLVRVVAGIRRLVAAERRGAYPGGAARRLDRRAHLGNQVYWWSRRALLAGRPLLAAQLLLAGPDFLFARLRQRRRAARRGLVPVTPLPYVRGRSGGN